VPPLSNLGRLPNAQSNTYLRRHC